MSEAEAEVECARRQQQQQQQQQQTKKPSFGELALMYDKPRSATVVAVADGSLWVLHREAFKSIMMQLDQDDTPVGAGASCELG